MTDRTHVFTSAAFNYLGKVRALFGSVRRHHPEFTCHLLAPERRKDAPPGIADDERWDEVHFVDDIPGGDDPSWVFRYDLVELATAIKAPFAASLLARSDCDRVIYLDPDIVLFSPIDDVVDALRRSSVTLTPHLVEPEAHLQGVLDNEMSALRHGAFNLGFLGVADEPQGHAFLEWWSARTEAFCFAELSQGLFTDQKWVDLAPGFFDRLEILRSPRLNVAPWNLGTREVTGSFDEGFQVGEEPLGFYHFTGFDSGAHRVMADKYAPGNPAVTALIDWYARFTVAHDEPGAGAWSLATYENGKPIRTRHRRAYRSEPRLRQMFPDPYAVGDGSYREWYRQHRRRT